MSINIYKFYLYIEITFSSKPFFLLRLNNRDEEMEIKLTVNNLMNKSKMTNISIMKPHVHAKMRF